MSRTATEVVQDMRTELAGEPNLLVLSELAKEFVRVTAIPPPPPDMVLRIRLNSDGGKEIIGYALDHVRAAWRRENTELPTSDTPFPVRNVAGDVVGSWYWGYKNR